MPPTQPQPNDPLTTFLQWYIGQSPVVPFSQYEGVSFVGDFALLTLFKQGQFQAQQTLCKPNSVIPEHSHPNVDTIVIYVSGKLDFTIDGKRVYKPEQLGAMPDGRAMQQGHFMRVGPGQKHGATIGPEGAAFITLQHWLKGEPQSVELDWHGPALSMAHAMSLELRHGVPVEITNNGGLRPVRKSKRAQSLV